MTEAKWLASTEPVAMLEFLRLRYWTFGAGYAGRPPDRKLRLFACACCHAVWDRVPCPECLGVMPTASDCPNPNCDGGIVGGLTDPRSRRAVEVAEAFADGEATVEELIRAAHECVILPATGSVASAMRAAWVDIAQETNWISRWCGVPPATQAALLRCLFNPWRPVTMPELIGRGMIWRKNAKESVIAHPLAIVRMIAQTIYADRAWGDLPVLADALEEAGCVGEECPDCEGDGQRWYCKACRGSWLLTDIEDKGCPMCPGRLTVAVRCEPCGGSGTLPHPLLAHLRGGGPHARGCWALDLILGKD